MLFHTLVLLHVFLHVLAAPVEVFLDSELAFEHQLLTISNKLGAPIPPEIGHSSHPGWVYGNCDVDIVCLDTARRSVFSSLSTSNGD